MSRGSGAPLRRRRLARVTVRARILAAVIALTALALAVAGYSAYAIQQLQVEARVDAELLADAEQFRTLHENGVDPQTGEPFASPADLVRTAMERIIPTRNEGIVGFVDAQIAYTSPVAPVALEEDRELTAALSEAAVADRATLQTLTTATTTYRAAVVPVHADAVTEDATGRSHEVAAFVMAYDLAAEKAVFAGNFISYIGIAVFSLGAVSLVGWLVAGRLLHPIRVLADSARRIGREDLAERIPLTGNDDLAEMTRSVNEMLERLQGAFEAQDRLVHDVSHELRTPLTILRGHLELLDADDPSDVAATRDLTLDELKRMNRVVDDLTTLAQADHPGFINPEAADVGTLTDEVYDKAIALGDRRWIISARAECAALLDRQRITQAWLQLAANAVKFSPPGSVIALASQVEEESLRFTVQDQGRGISEQDLEMIFERFGRADRSQQGSGLGLPIVAAIVRGHGGDVQVSSERGTGSTFTIVIPHREDSP